MRNIHFGLCTILFTLVTLCGMCQSPAKNDNTICVHNAKGADVVDAFLRNGYKVSVRIEGDTPYWQMRFNNSMHSGYITILARTDDSVQNVYVQGKESESVIAYHWGEAHQFLEFAAIAGQVGKITYGRGGL